MNNQLFSYSMHGWMNMRERSPAASTSVTDLGALLHNRVGHEQHNQRCDRDGEIKLEAHVAKVPLHDAIGHFRRLVAEEIDRTSYIEPRRRENGSHRQW